MKGRKPHLKVVETTEDHSQFDPRERSDWEQSVPDHIPAEMADEWRKVVYDLTGRKLLVGSMLGSVDAYILALWNARLAQKEIDKHGLLVASGKDGVVKQNPAVSLLGKANEAVLRLATELGLTPASRSKAAFQPPKEQEKDLFSGLLDI